MASRAGRAPARAASLLVIVVMLWLAVTLPALAADAAGYAQGVESSEAETIAAVSPSGVAGLSLLAAAVVATLWNVAVGERRAREGARA